VRLIIYLKGNVTLHTLQ